MLGQKIRVEEYESQKRRVNLRQSTIITDTAAAATVNTNNNNNNITHVLPSGPGGPTVTSMMHDGERITNCSRPCKSRMYVGARRLLRRITYCVNVCFLTLFSFYALSMI